MKSFALVLFILSLVVSGPSMAAGTRDHLFHQGVVVDTSGNPLSGSLNVTFRVYDSLIGSNVLWEEAQTLFFEEGLFSAELGSVEVFPEDLFDHETLFLGVQIEGDTEMSPRLTLYSVPWAQQAEVAVTALSLADNIVTSEKIAPGAITSEVIAAGSIGPAELVSSGVTPGTYSLATITVDADGRVTSASNGSAASVHVHPAGDITSGILADARLSTNVSLLGSSIESTEITDGTITNADIHAAANIGWAKIDKSGAAPGDVGAAASSHTHVATNITGELIDAQVSDALTSSVVVSSTQAAVSVGAYGTLAGETGEIRFGELAANGPNYAGFKAPDSLATSQVWVLPNADGTVGQVLTTDGLGVLNWATSAGGDMTGVTAGTGLAGGGLSGNVTLSADGPGITNLNASNLATGTVPNARLSASVSLLGSSIESAEVADGTITNADINASAAVDWSKISKTGALPGDVGAAASVHVHSAGDLASGTLADARLSTNVSLLGSSIESAEITDGTITSADLAMPSPINIDFFDSSSASATSNSTNDCVNFNNTGTTAGRLGQGRIVTMDGFSTIRLIARSSIDDGQGQHTMRIQNMTDGTTLVSISSGWTTTCATQTATASIALTGQKKLECQESGAASNEDPNYSHCAIELY